MIEPRERRDRGDMDAVKLARIFVAKLGGGETAPISALRGVFLKAQHFRHQLVPQVGRGPEVDAEEQHRPICDGNELFRAGVRDRRSEEHTSELQSLMRISYAVFCLKKKNNINYEQFNSLLHLQ